MIIVTYICDCIIHLQKRLRTVHTSIHVLCTCNMHAVYVHTHRYILVHTHRHEVKQLLQLSWLQSTAIAGRGRRWFPYPVAASDDEDGSWKHVEQETDRTLQKSRRRKVTVRANTLYSVQRYSCIMYNREGLYICIYTWTYSILFRRMERKVGH